MFKIMSKVTCIFALALVFSTTAYSHTDSKSCSGPSFAAMTSAIKSNKSTVVQCLIKKGFDVNTQNINSDTALIEAAWEGHIDTDNNDSTVPILIEAAWEGHIDTDNNDSTVPILIEAAWEGHIDTDNNDSTVPILIEAACEGHEDIIQLLLQAGAIFERCDISWSDLLEI